MYQYFIIISSVCSLILLTVAIVFLSTLGPLEESQSARTFVSELLAKDPKVQRQAAKGESQVNLDQTAAEVLSFLDQHKHYPITALGFSVVLILSSLILFKRHANLAGSLSICAAVASFFTIVPPVLQLISGIVLIKKSKQRIAG